MQGLVHWEVPADSGRTILESKELLHLEDPVVRKQFGEAITSFKERALQDKRVLALLLFGSMAYDEVTERSNINMFVITDEGRHRTARLIEHGVPIDVAIYSRNHFMRLIQRPRGVGILQVLGNSKLIFSRDCSFTDFYRNLSKQVGMRDKDYLQITYHSAVTFDLSKAEKYLYIKKDLANSFRYFVHGMNELGYLICYIHGMYPPREVIVRARELEPDVFPQLFDELLDGKITEESMERALRRSYDYLDSLDLLVYKPILDYISENDGNVTQTDIISQFRPRGLSYIDLEHLHRRRILRRTISPIKLTKRGLVDYSEPQYHFHWDSFDAEETIPTKVGPSDVGQSRVLQDYQKALNDLVEKAKSDEYMLSFILTGSLSYDTVWEKSDIDAVLVTRDATYGNHHSLVENDVVFDAEVFTRDELRKFAQRSIDGSIQHSWLSKSKVIYSRDDTIYDLYEDIQNIGSRDLERRLLLNYIFCKDLINKAHKAIHVKDDPNFSVNFVMSGIIRMANIEVLLNRAIPLRDSTLQALEFNPDFFNSIFNDFILGSENVCDAVAGVLERMESYLDERLETFAQPILRLLEKEHEVTHYDLKEHFGEIRLALDLRDFVQRGLIHQTEVPIRFTKKSTSEVIQPAYQLAGGSDDMMMDFPGT